MLGGWLTDTYSWRWVFYVNLPVGIASLVMTKPYIFDPPYLRRETQRIDYWGIGLLAREPVVDLRVGASIEGGERRRTATCAGGPNRRK